MTNYTRPPFFFATWLDSGGSSAHRVRRPMEILQRHGLAQGRFEDSAWPEELVALLKPDVFLWARMSEQDHINYMEKCRRACPTAVFIYEIDDALDVVPGKSPHRPHMRIDIADQMIICAKMCDIVTVSTDDLAKHMRKLLGDDMEIRVVPNMMADEDFATAAEIRQQMLSFSSKPRIGWGGGISHKGDLDLLIPVIEHFSHRVEWVFLGMQPDVRLPVEFHPGVLPNEYLSKLASLNLDLMIAPLEDNLFNQCKSNLRLLEGGACAYPVVASPVAPYLTRNPPVFAYAKTTKEWIAAIDKFISLPTNQQKKHGKAMQDWVQKHYNLDDNAEKRLAAWLPKGAKFFEPRIRGEDAKKVSVVGMLVPGDETFVAAQTLSEALATNNDVLWLRPVTGIVLPQMHLMKNLLDKHQAASVCAMTNGTGETGFPNRENLFNCNPENADAIDNILREVPTEDVDLCFPNGPAILLSRRALNTVGIPQLADFGDENGNIHEEAALYEWGINARVNGFQNKVANVYAVTSTNCTPFDVTRLSQYAQSRYGIDVSVPDVCKPIRRDIELTYHKKFYRPTPVATGNYQEWADVWDTLTKPDIDFLAAQQLKADFFVVADNAQKDVVQAKCATVYKTISEAITAARVTHSGRSQWLMVVKDGILRPHALWMMDRAAKADTVAIYGDHDYSMIDEKTKKPGRRDPDFKSLPFDHDLLLARDYVSPICALNLAHLDERYLEDSITGVYAVFLDLVKRFGKERIVHVPSILFHADTKPVDTVKREVRRKCAVAHNHAKEMEWPMSVQVHTGIPAYGQVSYKSLHHPKVSIIIPTKDKLEMLQPCVDSILAFTDYPNYEIIIVDNGSTNPKHIAYRKALNDPKIRVLEWNHPFNYSSINNYAAGFATGELLLLLNDDTRIVPESPNWLSLMVGCAERKHVGTVGAKLVHPWGTIQHIGVANEFGMCGHYHHSLSVNHIGYQGIAILSHEVTANTAACLLIRKTLYDEIGGLDEKMPNNFGDIALCHDVYKKGYVNICVMDAVVQHFETVTRKKEPPETMYKEAQMLKQHWDKPDPYWNRNLSIMGQQNVGGMNFNLPAWPGQEHPWRKEMKRQPPTVLLIGDYNDELMRHGLANADRMFQSMVSSYQLYFIHPLLQNVDPIDIRKPLEAVAILQGLGIDRIVVRSLRGMPLELLGFIRALGIETRYVPVTDEMITPITGMVNITQKDIDEKGTEWGQVNLVAWRAYWKEFRNFAKVDLSDAPELNDILHKICEEKCL